MANVMKAGGAGNAEEGKKKRVKLIIWIIVIILLAAAAYVGYRYLDNVMTEKWKTQVDEAKAKLDANKRFVYVASADIRAGETISEANVALESAYSSMDENLFASEEDLGKRAKVDIAAGTQVVKDMLLKKEFGAGDRAVEYKFIYCGNQIHEGDFVDVRIVYPDGTDYVILTKKCVEGIGENDDTSVVLWCNEEEMLLMSSAVVDAFVYSLNQYSVKRDDDSYNPARNSRIYAVKYVEPTLQDASVTAYVPSEATMNEIAADPNIVAAASEFLSVQIRAEYEERLFNYMSEETMNVLGYEDYDDFYATWQNYIESAPENGEGTPVGKNTGSSEEDDNLSGYDPSGN